MIAFATLRLCLWRPKALQRLQRHKPTAKLKRHHVAVVSMFRRRGKIVE